MERLRGGRIATVDGLRGIAILLVVWFHLWQISWQSMTIPLLNVSLQPLAETGFLGVALFFFISGFVLMLPYAEARLAGTPAPSLRTFFTRRFFKIVPSYVLCIAVMIALGYQTYANLAAAIKDVGLHLLFVHNWFAATNGSIDGVMWSLGVEIQFYLLFPLIAYAFVRRPVLVTVALFAVANAWRVWCMFASHFFYEQRLAQLPGYIDFFAAGMLGAWACVAIVTRRPALAQRRFAFSLLMAAGFVAFCVLAGDCYAHRYDAEWPQRWVVTWRSAVALSCFAMAVGAIFAARGLQLALANPLLLFLAAISYNLYLWHQPIAHALLVTHVPPFASADPHDDRVWMVRYWFVAIPAIVAVSAAITYAFERPLLHPGRLRFIARWKRAQAKSA